MLFIRCIRETLLVVGSMGFYSLFISIRFGHSDVSDRTRRRFVEPCLFACLLALEAYGFLFFYFREEFRWREEYEFLNWEFFDGSF